MQRTGPFTAPSGSLNPPSSLSQEPSLVPSCQQDEVKFFQWTLEHLSPPPPVISTLLLPCLPSLLLYVLDHGLSRSLQPSGHTYCLLLFRAFVFIPPPATSTHPLCFCLTLQVSSKSNTNTTSSLGLSQIPLCFHGILFNPSLETMIPHSTLLYEYLCKYLISSFLISFSLVQYSVSNTGVLKMYKKCLVSAPKKFASQRGEADM
jgi:hypothetical protein